MTDRIQSIIHRVDSGRKQGWRSPLIPIPCYDAWIALYDMSSDDYSVGWHKTTANWHFDHAVEGGIIFG